MCNFLHKTLWHVPLGRCLNSVGILRQGDRTPLYPVFTAFARTRRAPWVSAQSGAQARLPAAQCSA